MAEKTKYEKLEETLALKRKTVWETTTKEKQIMQLAEEYKTFLDSAKTEREAVEEIEKHAKKHRIEYHKNKESTIMLVKRTKQPLAKGIRIIASHIDSPRLDLKVNPLYEDTEIALLKTHYYGGVKKYQWVSQPLALHGVVILKNGKKVDIKIGEKESDPIFTIPDLLPHLSYKKQDERKAREVIQGEELNIICGSIPVRDEKVKEKVKLHILEMLNKEYGIIEKDFETAEIKAVPAYKARDLGFDRSLIAAYGHDDRSCAFPELKAMIDAKPETTSIAIFFDKEEIGSEGATGAKSKFLERTIEKLIQQRGEKTTVLEVLANSKVISSDVTAGVDPTFKEVMEARNSAYMGKGIAFEKYTGSGGKSGASEASAEYMRYLADLLDKNKVPWQTGGLGKVDEGGGGTVSKYLAEYCCDIIDAGVPVLGMHSPLEVISKADLHSAYEAYKVFLED